jgi:ABC-2 type transport system permease protein
MTEIVHRPRSEAEVTAPVPSPRELPTGLERITYAADTLLDLVFIQLSRVRAAWPWILLVSSATPIGMLFFLTFVAGSPRATSLLQYISGSVVVSLIATPLFMVAAQFAWARESRAFDFYAGLPVSRTALVLAVIVASVMFTLPGCIGLLALGMAVYHLWLVPNPLIVLVVILCPLALSGLGAMVGVLAPNQNVAGVTCNLLTVLIMFLSPVFVPISRLPAVLQVTARLLPPTYASDALRQTLTGGPTGSLAVDLVVLAVFGVGGISFVTSRLEWRAG